MKSKSQELNNELKDLVFNKMVRNIKSVLKKTDGQEISFKTKGKELIKCCIYVEELDDMYIAYLEGVRLNSFGELEISTAPNSWLPLGSGVLIDVLALININERIDEFI